MANNKEPIAKKCRSLDISPAVMGYGNKKSTRNPGGNKRKKVSEYGTQLKDCLLYTSSRWATLRPTSVRSAARSRTTARASVMRMRLSVKRKARPVRSKGVSANVYQT